MSLELAPDQRPEEEARRDAVEGFSHAGSARFWWPGIIIVSAIATGSVVAAHVGPPIQPLVAFCFLLVCPGMAFVRLLRLEDRLAEVVLAIALSMAIDVIVSEALVYEKLWAPERALVVLICVSLLGAMFQVVASLRRDR